MKCPHCEKEMHPYKKFSWLWFIAFILCCYPLAIVQIIYYITKKAEYCPYCKKNIYK